MPSEGLSAAQLAVAAQKGVELAEAVVAERAAAAAGAEALPGSAGIVVAEGDSWFDYPFHDVLKELRGRFGFRVESVAHHGDTAEGIAYDRSQLDRFAGKLEELRDSGLVPRAILISAGGNDIAGTEFALLLNHRASGLDPLNEDIVRGAIDIRLRAALVSILFGVSTLSQHYFGVVVPILVHGYDFPVPDGRGVLGGFWLLPGPWLEPGFRRKGYDDVLQNVLEMQRLMDRLNGVLEAVPLLPGLSHVRYVDLRGSLSSTPASYRTDWANELHPTGRGFEAVARRFNAVLAQL